MNILQEAQKLGRAGRQAEAVALVQRAAEDKNPDAMLMAANWRLFGLYGPRDLNAVHRLLADAAEAGQLEAARLRAYLIGNGTGCPSDPDLAFSLLENIEHQDPCAALQIAVLDQVPPVEAAANLPVTPLSEEPLIFGVADILPDSECDYLRKYAEPLLQPSWVIDPRTGQRIPHPVRTSDGTSFGPHEEDLIVQHINRRLAALTRTETGWGEPLHILRYSPGQEYKPHLDALSGTGNQRKWTVLIYLNEDFEGGETVFPELDLRFRGKKGDALVFLNVRKDGEADPLTRHAGLPVVSGEKWLATRWIRHGPYNPWE